MSIPGAVTITRVSYPDGQRISIRIEDRLSRRCFVEVQMSLEAFANAVTGFSYQPSELQIQDLDLVGKKLEIKHVIVPQAGFDASKEAILDALEPFEVNGWMGCVSDMTNHHNFCGDKVRVHFKRYVPATKADIEEARKKNE